MVQIRKKPIFILVFVMSAVMLTTALCKVLGEPPIEVRWEDRGRSDSANNREFLAIQQNLVETMDSIPNIDKSEVAIHETEKGIAVDTILYPVHNESLTPETLDSITLLIQNSIANLSMENINIVVDRKS